MRAGGADGGSEEGRSDMKAGSSCTCSANRAAASAARDSMTAVSSSVTGIGTVTCGVSTGGWLTAGCVAKGKPCRLPAIGAAAPSAPPPGAKQGNGAIGFPIGVLRCVVTGALRCMGAEIPAGCIDVGANGAGTGAWIIAILFRYAAPGGGTTNCGGGIVICTA